MSSPTYSQTTNYRPAQPRSKRRQVTIAASSLTYAGGASESVSAGGHTHDNLPLLNRIAAIDDAGDLYVTIRDDDNTEEVKVGAGHADRADIASRATTADYAEDVDPNAPGLVNNYLSKTHADTAAGEITFGAGVKLGTYLEQTRGGKIDAAGNAELESLKIRSALEVKELVVNRQSILDGDQILAPGDTITTVLAQLGGRYRLGLRPKYNGYQTAFAVGDIVRGVLNTLTSGGGYRTSWMRVVSVNGATDITVELYAAGDTPAGVNYAPAELMVIARWGHVSDPSRQTCFYLSSTEGRIVRVKGVNSPMLSEGNYATIIGELPEGFLVDRHLPTLPGLDYTYNRGLIVQDIIRTDYAGNPVPLTGVRPNILDGTETPYDYIRAAGDNATIAVGPGSAPRSAHIVCGNAPHGSAWEWIAYPIDETRLEQGKTYTLSLDITADVAVSLSVAIERNIANSTLRLCTPVVTPTIAAATKTRITIPLTINADPVPADYPRAVTMTFSLGRGEWGDITIANIKLEEGASATDWTTSEADNRRAARGATMRGPREWSAEDDYQSDADGGRYIDVVIYDGNYYYCKQSHTAPHLPGTTDGDPYWQLGDKVGLIATGLLLSEYAKIDNLGVSHVETSAGEARIEIDGGEIRAYGTRNANHPNIRFGIDETGAAVIQFFDHFGNLLYDLGPNGLRYTTARAEHWDDVTLYPVTGYAGSDNAEAGWKGATGTTYKQYTSAVNAGIVIDPEHDGIIVEPFEAYRDFDQLTPLDGWFVGCGADGKVAIYTIATAAAQYGQQVVDRRYSLLYCYTSGRCVRVIKAYYNG